MKGYAAIGLDNPKNGINVGSALRAAGCYGASLVAVSGPRPNHYLHRMPTDTQKVHRHIPVQKVDDLRSVIPHGCVPVAVDLIEGPPRCTNTGTPNVLSTSSALRTQRSATESPTGVGT